MESVEYSIADCGEAIVSGSQQPDQVTDIRL